MPLGWLFIVTRQNADAMTPPKPNASPGDRIAVWQTGLDGVDWLRELQEHGKVQFLAYNGGYPYEYTAQAKHLLPRFLDGPPLANKIWKRDSYDTVRPGYLGRTTIYREVAAQCSPDEWLYVQVWDES